MFELDVKNNIVEFVESVIECAFPPLIYHKGQCSAQEPSSKLLIS